MSATFQIKSPRKLIEVAMPLDVINVESLRRKQKAPKGWPTSFHKWWAQRPLAAARAVIFGQIVNDPSWQWELENPGKIPPNNLKASWAKSRKRLFAIMGDLVLWDNSNNQAVLQKARVEMMNSWKEVCEINKDHPEAKTLFNPSSIPALHDPFTGSGTIPLEAQRLGIDARASDLNPVAVTINKALIEYPRKFAGRPPVGPTDEDGEQGRKLALSQSWPNATGLAEDVRRYSEWIKREAHRRIGHLYPPIGITAQMASERPDLKPLIGQKLTIIAWIWARTVKSPNPAFAHVDVPLASSFILSSKAGKQTYVMPKICKDKYSFSVKVGNPPDDAQTGTSAGKRKAFRCIVSNSPIDYDYIRAEGKAGRIGQKLMAMVAESKSGRVFLSPTDEMEAITEQVEPTWKPDLQLPDNPRDFKPPNYGITNYGDLFTNRQLLSLITFSDLIVEARDKIQQDALKAGMEDDGIGLNAGGKGATAYAEAMTVYLSCVLDRMVYYGTSLTTWLPKDSALRDCMPRQALAMTWDFAECNPLGKSSGDISTCMKSVSNYLDVASPYADAHVWQQDAAAHNITDEKVLVSTDPPYYDNIGYADLSDFFYIWMRRTLRPIYPDIFATLAVPKAEELVATPYRHGNKENAESFFLNGMTEAMKSLAQRAHPAMPVTIYYAFKQSETEVDEGTSSAGWETFLAAVLRSGLLISGTWPLRTEGAGRMMANENNALASSIVLVCRKRSPEAITISRREFLRELSVVLPNALDEMTKGADGETTPIAPVDLSQAIIGPGMAVFSKYSAVLEADGSPMTVKNALQLINRFLAEDDFDSDTQFCLSWFEQCGWKEGLFGEADTLSRAKGTSVDGVKDAGVIESGSGKVRLLKWTEYPTDWDPTADIRLPIWESLHHLIRLLKKGGAGEAAKVLSMVKTQAESIRQLAYRLYTLCERQGWAEDARAYNELVTSWSSIEEAAAQVVSPEQALPGFES